MDNENEIQNSSEYDSEEEEAQYLRDILKNKKVEDSDSDIDIDNNQKLNQVKKNKNKNINVNINIKNKPKDITKEVFKNSVNDVQNKHKYYFRPKLPSIYKS
jgi:hypothetical protein